MNKHFNFLKGKSLKSLGLPALLGAASPFFLLSFIIFSKEDALEFWMLVPLVLIPLAGAIGGAFFYLMGFVWFPKGNPKLIALVFSTLMYFVVMWIGAVIAFNFTGHFN